MGEKPKNQFSTKTQSMLRPWPVSNYFVGSYNYINVRHVFNAQS